MTSGIYRIVHVSTQREYIGQAQHIAQRWGRHRRLLRNGNHHSPHLQAAWLKHGESAFAFEVLQYCRIEELTPLEQQFFDERTPIFNACPVAGSSRGFSPSEETRKKLSKAGTGRKQSDETRAKKRLALTGRKRTEEQRARMRGRVKSADEINRMRSKLIGRKLSPEHRAKVGRKGPKHSPETIAKIRAALSGQKRTPEQRERMRRAARLREQRKKEKKDG